MSNERICRLIKTLKKDSEWMTFTVGDSQEIRFLIKNDPARNKKKVKVIIDCPKNIDIDFNIEEIPYIDDNVGNC